MKDENVLFRSIQGIAFFSIAPLIFLTASLWFTSDKLAYFLAHLYQIYFSILLFFLFGNIWSIRSYDGDRLKLKLVITSLIPFMSAIVAAFITIFNNPSWGILFLLAITYSVRHIKFVNSMIDILDSPFKDLINKISIILCICLMLVFTYWVNPYTYPLGIYN